MEINRPGKLSQTVGKLWIVMALMSGLAACTALAPSPTPEPLPTATATVPPCQPSPIQTSPTGFSEIQGNMHTEGELWALLFFGRARVGEELKIVWRMTGTDGEFNVEGRHEDGTLTSPIWGPEAHGGSTWERPGDEWGTGFNFPQPGCWTLTASRGPTSGQIYLDVLP